MNKRIFIKILASIVIFSFFASFFGIGLGVGGSIGIAIKNALKKIVSKSEKANWIWILIGSLLLFIVSSVSLCCTPLKKPASKLFLKLFNTLETILSKIYLSIRFIYFLGLLAVLFNIFYSLFAADEIALPKWLNPQPKEGEIEIKQGSPFYIVTLCIVSMFMPFYIWSLSKSKKRYGKLRQEKITKVLKNLGWVYFFLSAIGALMAIKYPQTGTFISLNGVIQEKILEKVRTKFEEQPEIKRIKELEEVVILTSHSLLSKNEELTKRLENRSRLLPTISENNFNWSGA